MLRAAEDGGGATPSGRMESGEFDGVSADLVRIFEQLRRLARIRLARARIRAGRTLSLVLAGLVLVIVTTAITLSGAHLFVRGLTAGLTELAGGRTWVGELGTGVLLLAGTAASFLALRSWSERRIVRDALGRGDDEPKS